MTGPYAAAAQSYWQAGWRGILPLPPKKKANPPTGFTGDGGKDPSYPDVFTWAEGAHGAGNIALRLPRDVIGLDVDNYGDKHGALAVATAETEWGQLPPTWRSTSRDDGVSGIRLYRVPEGLAWPGELGAGTEIIQHGHRYAVVCPSLHPEGRTYRWINAAGITSTSIPDPDELPSLPDAWIAGLTRGEMATATLRGSLTSAQTAGWLVTLPRATEALCHRMSKAVDQTREALHGSAHTAGRDGSLRCIRLASEGHGGLVTALSQVQRMFTDEATSGNRDLLGKRRRTTLEARQEWNDLVTSAANLVQANPTGHSTCDCEGQLTGLLVTRVQPLTSGANALAPQAAPLPAPAPSEQEKEPTEASARLKDGATFILDAPDHVPTVWGDGDEVFWAEGEALMLVGPPGVGKTTLCGQVLRARLGLDSHVLGMSVTPSTGRVLYLAMDRPQQIARALRRTFNDSDREILADKLRVWEGPPPGDVAKNTTVLLALAQLAEADTLIIDSVKDAAIGLTEDEVAAGYNRARQTALAGGVQVLELHHLVKRGANGGKPNTLADVYGSAWLTAGAGSVVLLWGAAGDLIVELSHLKQPAAIIGPYKVIHDHVAGSSTVFHQADLLALALSAGTGGLSAKAAAVALFEDDAPAPNDIEKARRRLDKLVEQGHLTHHESPDRNKPVVWKPVVEGSHAKSRLPNSSPTHGAVTASHAADKTAGQEVTIEVTEVTDTPTATKSRTSPLLKEGGRAMDAQNNEEIKACRTCGTVAPTLNAVGECADCGRPA